MKTVKVSGKKRSNKVVMYALSTCGWCKRTEQFLKDNNIEFTYVDVDLCSDEDREEIEAQITKLGRMIVIAYPIIIVDDKVLISGAKLDKVAEALGL